MDTQPELDFDVEYPEHLSRLLIFVKWLLVIPQLIVLAFLGIIAFAAAIVAWFAILITGQFPRSLFDFNLMVFRWGARVTAYEMLMRDEYPPFNGTAPYPVIFELAYPAQLSRWKIFIKWILLIPHYIVLYVLGIVAGLIHIIAWFAILFTGNYPRGMFDFVVGFYRWTYRVQVYAFLMTDAYPPFMLGPTGTAPAPAFQ